jgi:DUF1009 family protein
LNSSGKIPLVASVSPRPSRQPKLGILAGGGRLPAHLIATCRAQARDHFVIAFRGFTDAATVSNARHEWVDLEKVGHILRRLREERVEDAVLAGPVRRPASFLALRPDWRGLQLLLKMLTNWSGDNHVLSAVVHEIERDGFHVVGAEDVAPDLLIPVGPLGAARPDARHTADIEIGVASALDLGRRDRGQAVIVADGRVLGRETAGGTAALLDGRASDPATRGGVLVKVAKPGQERRVDLPSVGVDTVAQAVRAGLSGIALEAGGALVIDRAEVIAAADRAGLFVSGIRATRSAP